MARALHKVCNMVVKVWVWLVGVVRWVTGKRGSNQPPKQQEVEQWGGDNEWDSWDSTDTFSVKVIPSNSVATSQSTGNNQGPPPPPPMSNPTEGEMVEENLFRDMQPVIRKAKKIHLKQSHSQEQSNSKQQMFMMDPSFQPESAELEVWNEESTSWEEGLGEEEGDLLRQSHEALREKRRQEKEQRKAQQEAMRNSQRGGPRVTHTLGTRVGGSNS